MENKLVDILLIEDNPSDAELAIRALRKNNMATNLAWVKDGEEACKFLFSKEGKPVSPGNPKLILLDLKLPKVSGLQILTLLKQNEKLKTVPVVILTSSKEDRDLSECYKTGANSYIVKPVGFKEFLNTISEIGSYWLHLNQSL